MRQVENFFASVPRQKRNCLIKVFQMIKISRLSLVALLVVLGTGLALSQTELNSEQAAETAMKRIWVDSPNGPGIPPKWVYDYGVILNGMKTLWRTTGDKRYYDFVKRGVDTFVSADGTIKTYTVDEYNLDQV